ncbi:membrane protein [Paenibacillus sp. J23TS9]|uniref:acyltransferase n=1 Tax=Paenibacillus sp. J23TS9 TaxID=2807193 RepID=UPI001B03A5BC|nr:acyltransferase [Paenibacillus sp. J23TS9]GIP27239.1 membrane protein [Paenibacillus sp. J23TS9]
MPKKARIREIELLRGLAFLAVALQHAIAHFSVVEGVKLEDGVIMTLLLMAAKFAVPVFIFITGLVLFYNYDGQINYFSFVRKRFMDILVPYILWSAIYFLVSPAWNVHQLSKWVNMLFTGKNSYHLWYIVMIFQFYLLFPLFRYFMRKCTQWFPYKWRAVALTCAGFLCLLLLENLFRISDVMTRVNLPFLTPFLTKYADRNFLYFMIYFILGAAAGMHPDRWKLWLEKGKLMYWTAFIGLFGYYTYITVRSFGSGSEAGLHISFNQLNLLRPLITIFLVCSIFVFYEWSQRRTQQSGPTELDFMNTLGRYSYGAYLVHALMLRQSYKIDEWLFGGWNVTLRMLMTFLICIILSYGLTIAMSYLPFGKWTVGVSSLPKKQRRYVPSQGQTPLRSVDGS